jgi:hypothetical protein
LIRPIDCTIRAFFVLNPIRWKDIPIENLNVVIPVRAGLHVGDAEHVEHLVREDARPLVHARTIVVTQRLVHDHPLAGR